MMRRVCPTRRYLYCSSRWTPSLEHWISEMELVSIRIPAGKAAGGRTLQNQMLSAR